MEYLNLLKKISFGSLGTIEYIYNSNGEKLQKKVTEASVNKTVDYLGGFQYENGNMEFFPTAEGYVKVTETGSVGKVFSYVYNHTDHLGNIRLRYTRDPADQGKVRILEENSYYPFGLKHEGYNGNHEIIINPGFPIPYPVKIISITPFDTDPYQYKYNGKEYQDELGLNFYDYGARNYDAALGRWMNVDPLAEIYRRWSPYTYGVDNPIKFFDPDGGGVLTDYYNLKGQHTKHVEDGKTDKKIVLTTSKKEADTDAAISNGHVVNQITNDQIKQIDDIYTFGKTDKTGTEKGFLFGQNGKSSKTVTGEKSGEIGSKEWADARKDLEEKGDKIASDAHLHLLLYDSDGNVTSYGAPFPSDTDKRPENISNNTQPSMILGWTEHKGALPRNQIGGAPSPNTYSPTIGFYNTEGSIITINYSTFKKAMKKINK